MSIYSEWKWWLGCSKMPSLIGLFEPVGSKMAVEAIVVEKFSVENAWGCTSAYLDATVHKSTKSPKTAEGDSIEESLEISESEEPQGITTPCVATTGRVGRMVLRIPEDLEKVLHRTHAYKIQQHVTKVTLCLRYRLQNTGWSGTILNQVKDANKKVIYTKLCGVSSEWIKPINRGRDGKSATVIMAPSGHRTGCLGPQELNFIFGRKVIPHHASTAGEFSCARHCRWVSSCNVGGRFRDFRRLAFLETVKT